MNDDWFLKWKCIKCLRIFDGLKHLKPHSEICEKCTRKEERTSKKIKDKSTLKRWMK